MRSRFRCKSGRGEGGRRERKQQQATLQEAEDSREESVEESRAVRRAERLEDRKPSFAQMERTRDSVKVNRLLEGVEAQRDAWIRDAVWEDILESGGGIFEEEEGRALAGGIVHQVLMGLIGEEWETDLCAEAGEFNPIARGRALDGR
jgi:hypothetical protein